MTSTPHASDFRYSSVILDSNLLLLLAVGMWNPRAIETQKRLGGFTYDDFEVLRSFLGSFYKVVTTAHVLTEVSNLAGAATGQSREAIFRQLASLINTMDERNAPAETICSQAEFLPFGLTDAALSLLCCQMLLVTEDGRLAHHLQLRGLNALTLQQVRALRYQANNA
jgi:rRNA-processing protein FCF1